MKTTITLTSANNSYTECIDNLNEAITAADYIDSCRANNYDEDDYWCNDIGAEITAKVYADDADPMFDEPVSVTCSTIEEI